MNFLKDIGAKLDTYKSMYRSLTTVALTLFGLVFYTHVSPVVLAADDSVFDHFHPPARKRMKEWQEEQRT